MFDKKGYSTKPLPEFTEEQKQFMEDNHLVPAESIIPLAQVVVAGKLRSHKLLGIFMGVCLAPICTAMGWGLFGAGSFLGFFVGALMGVGIVWLVDKVFDETMKLFLTKKK